MKKLLFITLLTLATMFTFGQPVLSHYGNFGCYNPTLHSASLTFTQGVVGHATIVRTDANGNPIIGAGAFSANVNVTNAAYVEYTVLNTNIGYWYTFTWSDGFTNTVKIGTTNCSTLPIKMSNWSTPIWNNNNITGSWQMADQTSVKFYRIKVGIDTAHLVTVDTLNLRADGIYNYTIKP